MDYNTSTSELALARTTSDWSYVAEGGANLLLRYVGSTSSQLTGKLLRLRKRRRISPGIVDGGKGMEGGIRVEESLHFVRGVALNLLGEEFGVETNVVEIGAGFIDRIQKALEKRNVRPKERILKDQLDEREGVGVLVDDLIGASGLAIEIKVSSEPTVFQALLNRISCSRNGDSCPPFLLTLLRNLRLSNLLTVDFALIESTNSLLPSPSHRKHHTIVMMKLWKSTQKDTVPLISTVGILNE